MHTVALRLTEGGGLAAPVLHPLVIPHFHRVRHRLSFDVSSIHAVGSFMPSLSPETRASLYVLAPALVF